MISDEANHCHGKDAWAMNVIPGLPVPDNDPGTRNLF